MLQVEKNNHVKPCSEAHHKRLKINFLEKQKSLQLSFLPDVSTSSWKN